jgi:type IV secretory pathway TraG/TraD family ATPase VirD4
MNTNKTLNVIINNIIDSENSNLLLIGKAGSGKSSTTHALLKEVLDVRGQAALLLDNSGDYFARFGRESDFVLNPLNPGTVDWNPMLEIHSADDCVMLASAAIPTNGDEWVSYAQILLAAILQAVWNSEEKDVTRILHLCAVAPATEVAGLLHGTPAETLASTGGGSMLGNVRAVVAGYLKGWENLKANGTFSVRKFVRDNSEKENGARLFLTHTERQLPLLKHLIATWIGLAISESRALPATRRLWLVLDGLNSIPEVSQLQEAAMSSNTPIILSTQNVAAIRTTYKNTCNSLFDKFSHKMFFAAADSETANFAASQIKNFASSSDLISLPHLAGYFSDAELNIEKISIPPLAA